MPDTSYWNELTPEQQTQLNELRHRFVIAFEALTEDIEETLPGWTVAPFSLNIDLVKKPTPTP